MTRGFGVDPTALRAAATAAREAAATMAAADLGGDAERVGAALPGSASAVAAARLAGSWRAGVAGWVREAGEHGNDLAAAAEGYERADAAGAAAFDASPAGTSSDAPNAILDALLPGGP